MDPINDQQNDQQNFPPPEPLSAGPELNNSYPDSSPVQPVPVPPTQYPQQPMTPAANQTDALGIASLIMIFVFPLVGVILGIIGLNKAKKEGYKNTLSKIGLIINSILVVLGIILFILWLVVFAAVGNEISNISQEIENQSQAANQLDSLEASDDSFVIASLGDIGGICEGGGWPSNATPSSSGNVVGLFSNRSLYPDIYSTQYASLTEYEDVDFENPTIVDTVVCLTSVDQAPIETVTCKLNISDVEVDAPMYRRPFIATAFSVSDKKEIATFTVQPESDCPFIASVSQEDNSFDAQVDDESLNLELNRAL